MAQALGGFIILSASVLSSERVELLDRVKGYDYASLLRDFVWRRRGMVSASTRTLREMAAVLGYDWSDDEIRRISAQLEKALALVDRLDSLPLREVEPATLYRIL